MKRKRIRGDISVSTTLAILSTTMSLVLLWPVDSGSQGRDATVDLLAELTNAPTS